MITKWEIRKILEDPPPQLISLSTIFSPKYWKTWIAEKAVETIRSNPKYFFSYAKRFQKTKSIIPLFRNSSNKLTSDSKLKAEILQYQYQKAFSDPAKANISACLQSDGLPQGWVPPLVTLASQKKKLSQPSKSLIPTQLVPMMISLLRFLLLAGLNYQFPCIFFGLNPWPFWTQVAVHNNGLQERWSYWPRQLKTCLLDFAPNQYLWAHHSRQTC